MMKRREFFTGASAIVVASRVAYSRPATAVDKPIALGGRRELFVDRYLIDQLTGAELRLCEPRPMESVIRMDQKWEGPYAGYSTVLHDRDQFLMYYRGVSKLGLDGSENERCCLAESTDGVHWVKPELGLYEFEGSTKNNITLDRAAPATHNFCPFIDTRPGVDQQERFKGVGGTLDKLFGFVSPDGRKWKLVRPSPILSTADVPFPHTHLFDSQNVVFWWEPEQAYVCYFRVWDGLRRIARTTSKDFLTWTPATLMRQVHDDGVHGPREAPQEHLYTNQTSPYFRAPHICTAMAARFFEGRQVVSEEQAKAIGVNPDFYRDTSDSVFMTTRGGDVYDRTFLEGHIKPGIGLGNWVSRTNYPALNVVQTGPGEMSFYVNLDYAQPTAHLRRYSLRLDGFTSLHAGAGGGALTTRLLTFEGRRLSINFATSAAGSIRVELADSEGRPYPGFGFADCPDQIGNEIERVVRWNAGDDVSSLAGKPCRIRFAVIDADLFAFQFLG